MADNQFIIRKGYIALDDSQITGSLSVTNSVTASFFTGSYRGDGSQLTGIEGFPFTGSAGITGSLTVVGPVNATTFTGDGSQLTGIEGFPFTGSAKITGSLEVTGSVSATSFIGNGSQLTGIDGFPFTGSAAISGSLIVVGPVNATSFTGSLQGTATSASYVQLANIDGFTAYSASVNTAIDSVLDATTPLTATVNTTNSPFTVTSQSIVIIDSTNGDVTVNLPDLNTINGTPDQKPILLYKNDYSQNVIYVEPSGSQLVNGTTQDIIVSIQIAIAYNPTSAGWVTEGTSYQSLAELEMFFVPRTETGSFATTGSNQFSGSQAITGSLTVTGNITGNITGSASTASYVEYTNVANKPALVSGSAQITYSGLTGIPSGIVSGSAQVTYSGLTGIPAGIVSGSSQVTYSGLTGIPSGIVSGSAQIASFGIFATTGSNGFNGSQSITGSLTVTGQVVAQTLNVQQVTSSIVYSSGSNIFGNSLANTQQFTGSLQVSGSSHNILGNVGIGPTGTPVAELQIGKSSDVVLALSNSSSVTSGNRGGIAWYNSSNSTVANIKAVAVTDNVGTQLEFYTRPAAGNLTQRLTIDSAGNLGLGVTPSAWRSTDKVLQINNSSLFDENGTNLWLGLNFYENSAGSYIFNNNGYATAYRQQTGQHNWFISTISGTAGNAISFTQAMTLDASGRLGIGSTSPSATLDVGSNRTLSGTDPISIYTDVRVASAVTGGLIGYNVRMVALAGSYTVANMYGIKTNTPVVQSGVTVTNSYGIYIGRTDDPSSGGVVTNKYALVTEATAGNVGIGTVSPSQKLVVEGSEAIVSIVDNRSFAAGVGGALYLLGNYRSVGDVTVAGYIKGSKVNSTDGDYGFDLIFATQQYTGGVAERFRITSTGVLKSLPTYNNTTGVAANMQIDSNGFFARSTSSLKYKKDIRNYDKGLDLINLLRPVYYKGKSESDGDKQFAGLIAEEVHDLGLTEFVQYAPDGSPDALSYQNMIALAIKAIQEQQSQIEILKAEIQTLKQ